MSTLAALGKAIYDRLTNEPVMVLGVVQMALALAVSFGLGLTGEQTGAILAFSAAVLSLIARSQVTPT